MLSVWHRCGIAGHTVEQCRYSKDIVCHGCRKAGHLQRACKGTNPSQNMVGAKKKYSHPRCPVRHIEEEGAGEEDVEEATLFQINASQRSPPIEVHLLVDNCCVRFEVDTGAAKSVMSQQIFNQLWPGRSLETTKVRLVSYSNEPIIELNKSRVTKKLIMMLEQSHAYSSWVMQSLSKTMVQDADGYLGRLNK